MTFLLSFLTSRLGGPVMGALAVALGLFLIGAMVSNAGLKGKVAKSEQTVANLRVDLRQCQANRVTLEASITRQNEAVGALKAEGDRMTRNAAKAVSDARAVAESERRRADRVLAARPQTCADLSNVLEGSLP